MWQPLFSNLAVTAMMLVAWNALSGRLDTAPARSRNLAFGAAMAIGVVGSMSLAYEVTPGVYFDLRAPIIAVTGLFGGPLAALVTTTAALIYRIYMGGAVVSGALAIASAAGLGLAGHFAWRNRPNHLGQVIALACGVAVASVIVVWTLPAEGRTAMLPALSASILLTWLSTLLLGAVVLSEVRRRNLATSNMLYRSMVDALPDCLNIKDIDGRFLAANPATARLMRAAAPADLNGKTDFDFYPLDLANEYRQHELDVLQRGTHTTTEQPGRLPDGATGWLSTLKAPVIDETGRRIGLITHNRDVTAQKALQDQLTETQAYLDQALEHMKDGLAMYDPEGLVLFCNKRYRELFPKTAHLRRPGSHYADIMRASVDTGEEQVPALVTLAEHIASKWLALKTDGDCEIELADGRTFLSQTKVLPNGCSLRMMSDITERRNFERDLEHRALHDPMTGLANRALFSREIERRINRARGDGSLLVVMLLDLDHFKKVNDIYGHSTGDQLLVEVSRRLEASTRPGDLVARLGGDEFAVLVSGGTTDVDPAVLAERILRTLSESLVLDGATLTPMGTIGYTTFPQDMSEVEGLLRHADQALYVAKAHGGGTWQAHDASAQSRTSSRRSGHAA